MIIHKIQKVRNNGIILFILTQTFILESDTHKIVLMNKVTLFAL